MTPQDLKLAVATGVDSGARRAGVVDGLNALADEVRGFAESLSSTADELSKGGDEAAAALQIAIARRVLEEAMSEAGDLFDVAVWGAGITAEVRRGEGEEDEA